MKIMSMRIKCTNCGYKMLKAEFYGYLASRRARDVTKIVMSLITAFITGLTVLLTRGPKNLELAAWATDCKVECPYCKQTYWVLLPGKIGKAKAKVKTKIKE